MLLLGAAAFAAGGLVKGTLGVGLPMVTVPLLALMMPSPQAISLVAAPVLVSNLWQAWDSGGAPNLWKRFASMLVPLFLVTLATVPLTLAMPPRVLNVLLAGALILAVLLIGFQPRLEIPPRQEKVASFVVGVLSGMLGAVSSLMGPILISYLMALRLSREEFIGSISIMYLVTATPLYGAMAYFGKLGLAELGLSVLAMLPMFAGMALGKRLRGRLNEQWFRRGLLGFLVVVAALLVLK
jgi:uncharacterized membrane protein YfcA